jgi:hypothetical protein
MTRRERGGPGFISTAFAASRRRPSTPPSGALVASVFVTTALVRVLFGELLTDGFDAPPTVAYEDVLNERSSPEEYSSRASVEDSMRLRFALSNFPTFKCALLFGCVMSKSRVRFTLSSRDCWSYTTGRPRRPFGLTAPPPPSFGVSVVVSVVSVVLVDVSRAFIIVSNFFTFLYGHRATPWSRHRCFNTVTHIPS